MASPLITTQNCNYHKCWFTGCERSKARCPDLHFFRFPTKWPKVCEQWVKNCANDNLTSLSEKTLSRRLVCEMHFIDDCFTSTMKTHLKKNAVPTLLLLERMTGCCAIGCTNRDSKGFLMKRFPRDPERRKIWAAKVKRKNWTPTNNSCLCEVHFAPEMFEENRADGRKMLKYDAIPTIFTHIPQKKFQKAPIKRCFRKFSSGATAAVESNKPPEQFLASADNAGTRVPTSSSTSSPGSSPPLLPRTKRSAESETEYLDEDYIYAEGNLCRFCTKSVGEDGKDIFSDDRESVNIQEIMNLILPGQVHEKDKLPHHICVVCTNKWKKCYKNILEFFAAEAYFRRQKKCDATLVADQLASSNGVAASPETISDVCLPPDFSNENNTLFIQERQNNIKLKNNILEVELETKDVNNSNGYSEDREQCKFCLTKFSSLKELALHIEVDHSSTNTDQTFCCNMCSAVFENKHMLLGHVHSSHPDENIYFPCEDCPNVFNHKHLLIQHRKLEHKKHICKVCGEAFYYGKTLDHHMSVHNSSIKCSTCNKVFKNAYWRRVHEKSHTLDNNHLCWICGKFFQIKSSLDFHLKSHEGLKVNPYKCPICGKEYFSISGINKHKLIHKERVRSFKCTKCNKAFFTNDSLKQHFSCHSNVKPNVCHCGVAFKRRSNLYKHKKRHLLEENSNKLKTSKEMNKDIEVYTCSFCGKEVISKLRLKYHLGRHTGNLKPFDCEICGALFGNLTNYKNHVNIHSTDLLFMCETCGLGFRTGRMLKQHKLVHEEERPYACPSCPVSFKRLYSLKEHKIVHSGLRPYECTLCKKSFARRSDCRKHIKRSHEIPVQQLDLYLHNIINVGQNDKTNKKCNPSDIKDEQGTKVNVEYDNSVIK